jgi:hypothetical protein
MTRAVPPLLTLTLIATLSCGGSDSPAGGQDPPPPPSSSSDRLAWDQRLSAGESASDFGYAVYVDSRRADFSSTSCGTPANGVVSCTAPLPVMTPGTHVLELVSFRRADGIESERAAPVTVVVAGTPPPPSHVAPPAAAADMPLAALDCSVHPLGSDRALLASTDGQLSIRTADGSSRVRLEWTAPAGEWTLRSAAPHADYDTNGLVFVLFAGGGSDAGRVSVVRYRDAGGLLGERATIFTASLDAGLARPRLRAGPGGSLLLLLLDGPTSSARDPRHFLIKLDDRGGVAAESRHSSVYMDLAAAQPFELDWPASSDGPWSLSGLPWSLRSPSIGTRGGGAEPLPSSALPGAVPVGLAVAAARDGSGRARAWVVASDGTVERLDRARGRWTPLGRLQIDGVDAVFDARMYDDDSTIAYCGSQTLDSGATVIRDGTLSVRRRSP